MKTQALGTLLAIALALTSGASFAQKAPNPKITGAEVVDGSITSADIADDSLTGADIAEETLSGIDAGTLDGMDSREFARGKSYAFNRLIACAEAGLCSQALEVRNEEWPFWLELECTKPSESTTRIYAGFAGNGWATSPPSAEVIAETATGGYLTFTKHVPGSPILIDGVPTDTAARIEVLGWIAPSGICFFSGIVEDGAVRF